MLRVVSSNSTSNVSTNRVLTNIGSSQNRVHTGDSISLSSWISSFHDESELREVFLNMDIALHYLHSRNYCVKTFDPRRIQILNDSVDQIRFDIMPMPSELAEQRRIIKQDIYNSAFIQIGLYSKCLSFLSKPFLEENFDRFEQFLPERDVPYYKGVVEMGASVYFCEYAAEKDARDLSSLEAEISGTPGVGHFSKSAIRYYNNDKINDYIYKDIGGNLRETAFVSFLIFPTAILILGFIFALVAWIVSFM